MCVCSAFVCVRRKILVNADCVLVCVYGKRACMRLCMRVCMRVWACVSVCTRGCVCEIRRRRDKSRTALSRRGVTLSRRTADDPCASACRAVECYFSKFRETNSLALPHDNDRLRERVRVVTVGRGTPRDKCAVLLLHCAILFSHKYT